MSETTQNILSFWIISHIFIFLGTSNSNTVFLLTLFGWETLTTSTVHLFQVRSLSLSLSSCFSLLLLCIFCFSQFSSCFAGFWYAMPPKRGVSFAKNGSKGIRFPVFSFVLLCVLTPVVFFFGRGFHVAG